MAQRINSRNYLRIFFSLKKFEMSLIFARIGQLMQPSLASFCGVP